MSASPVAFATVALCTRNRAHTLPAAIEALLEMDHPRERFEIVIVDDASDDSTEEVASTAASRHPGLIRYLRRAERHGLSSARNTAIIEGRGDLICFTDDDAVVSRQWLTAMVDGADRNRAHECFAGRLLLRLEGPTPRTCGKERLAPFFDEGDADIEVDRAVGANMAIRRSAFEHVGLFNPALKTRGDEDNWRRRYQAVGGRVMYLAAAVAWHRRLPNELRRKVLLKTRFHWGIAQVQFKRETGDRLYGRSIAKAGWDELRHAARHRCFGGLMDAAMRAGALWAAARGELRKVPTTPPRLPAGPSVPAER